MKDTWNIQNRARGDDLRAIATELKLCDPVAAVLCNRGLRTPEQARSFLLAEDCFHDPFLLADMDSAVLRLKQAVDSGEKIAVYGDYDVDGVTSTALLCRYLSQHTKNTSYYIPSRHNEGYGLNCTAVRRLAEDGVTLIITVDCGITATAEVELATSLGIDTIITDHHTCSDKLPPAVAVVNSHREDCDYPFRGLAGVGVAFKLACAYEWRYVTPNHSYEEVTLKMLERYGEFVATGTIADMMPMIGENRCLVRHGLRTLEDTKNHGFAALIEACGGKDKGVSSTTISFGMAPRINAAGRMDNAGRAVELFLTDTPYNATTIATELCDLNQKRQAEEGKVLELVRKEISADDISQQEIIIAGGEGWHQGVIGIVASKIVEQYGLPCVIISLNNGIGSGSARSVGGLDMVDALRHCSDLLVAFGGHSGAAGLTIEEENIAPFRAKMQEYIAESTDDSLPAPGVDIEYICSPQEISLVCAKQLRDLEPHGPGNPQPLFLTQNMRVAEVVALSGGKHTKLQLYAGNAVVAALCFGTSPASLGLLPGDEVNVVYNMEVNRFGSTTSVQLIVRDIAPAAVTEINITAEQEEYTAVTGGCGIREEHIPTRQDFASVYQKLRLIGDTQGGLYSLRILSHSVFGDAEHSGYIKTRIALDVFAEIGLISVTEKNTDSVEITLCQVSMKADLESSEILRKIRELCTQTS